MQHQIILQNSIYNIVLGITKIKLCNCFIKFDHVLQKCYYKKDLCNSKNEITRIISIVIYALYN